MRLHAVGESFCWHRMLSCRFKITSILLQTTSLRLDAIKAHVEHAQLTGAWGALCNIDNLHPCYDASEWLCATIRVLQRV